MTDLGINVLLTAMALLPGVIWALIWLKYSKTRIKADKFYFLIYSVVASVLSYFSLLPFGLADSVVLVFKNNNITTEKLGVIIIASCVACGFALLSIVGSHRKWILRILNIFKITNRYGDEDLWENSLYEHIQESGKQAFIKVYDQKTGFIYSGFLYKISEDKDNKELVINGVEIHNSLTGELIIKMEKIYLPFSHKDFFIEFKNTNQSS